MPKIWLTLKREDTGQQLTAKVDGEAALAAVQAAIDEAMDYPRAFPNPARLVYTDKGMRFEDI